MKSPEIPEQNESVDQAIINKLTEANQRLEKAGDDLPQLLAEAERLVAEGILVKESSGGIDYFYVPDPAEDFAIYTRRVLEVKQASFLITLYDQTGQSIKVTEIDTASRKTLNQKEWQYNPDGKLVSHIDTDGQGVKRVTEYDGAGNRKK